ncbi:MAG: succinate dehydrogenase [Deltaproteobacteria bacterium RIFCSPLOWO2_01_44_7]|nr:MAG: succinate dehydrogenase [Deltaproteobacteria bacterium RIFCSPHIGHO2_01_FULL_43_49]OGQ14660.1 MAG: succinate dehydrogenase [Deltaproteobacteria bacterium RIFCSPHIGHO2_02_FULL_44_53]OGQ28046.1 MAG: succinate dehydrogenase [Deltaproteobacteria bacterium RIFCSPHIGHO2_12_FULL_44_21]OGQ31258.1 MAG: succinate dehydrogenase [Deltaproteobacteria bacterium RIFCSPLOWO2_01_FULL_45_74]OGQ41475.1 MAG: succinate dehydrogenase [Deltaproteobacteria bacterium RIFCSPLOWO2_01_44_7]OGQ43250.1 MAG: succinat
MSLGETQRKDLWWLQPLLVVLGFGSFVVYSTWAAFEGNNYQWGPYLSPFYSPLFLFDWWHWSPAFLILWAPLGFRATCYYYRKAYYRSFFLDPPACAVGEIAEHRYSGETKFPFILQNLHRFFMYVAVAIILVLWYDVYEAFWFDEKFGIGVGTLVLFLNTFFLSLYTFSCHSLRHIVGGGLDCFSSCALAHLRHKAWSGVSLLNERHMLWAWISLFTVGLADLYVRLCAMGVINDIRLI